MYRNFPNAHWYVMIDDDTYLFLDNLEISLKSRNWNEPHYLGVPTYFSGCDGVSKFGDGPFFAHGGSGIIMSRAALKKLVAIVDECIKKYHDCWGNYIIKMEIIFFKLIYLMF